MLRQAVNKKTLSLASGRLQSHSEGRMGIWHGYMMIPAHMDTRICKKVLRILGNGDLFWPLHKLKVFSLRKLKSSSILLRWYFYSELLRQLHFQLKKKITLVDMCGFIMFLKRRQEYTRACLFPARLKAPLGQGPCLLILCLLSKTSARLKAPLRPRN